MESQESRRSLYPHDCCRAVQPEGRCPDQTFWSHLWASGTLARTPAVLMPTGCYEHVTRAAQAVGKHLLSSTEENGGNASTDNQSTATAGKEMQWCMLGKFHWSMRKTWNRQGMTKQGKQHKLKVQMEKECPEGDRLSVTHLDGVRSW